MLKTAIKNVRQLPKVVKEAWVQRQRKKVAQIEEIEARERKTLVNELTKKFAAAHDDCEQNKKSFAAIEFSIKEIIFIEGYLESWNRYFRERDIYRLPPASNV
jgi:transcriptional regulator with AAA-type ATPase domain